MSREKQETLALGVVIAEHKTHRWQDIAISLAVVGAMIAVAFYARYSPARQENRVGPSWNDAEPSAEVRDCIRAKRIEIVDDAGYVVGVVQSVGRGEDSSGYLELLGHGERGDRKGRMVYIDPQQVIISGDGGCTECWATGLHWKATMPSAEDDLMVRIDADSDGGSVHVKCGDSTWATQRWSTVNDAE